MRSLLIITFLFLATSIGAAAQPIFSQETISEAQRIHNQQKSTGLLILGKKKWSLDKFAGVSTGIVSWKGGTASFFSIPVGLQLNRRINNNLAAFAAVSVGPAYVHFNQRFLNTNFTKNGVSNSFLTNRPSMYSKAELGLSYTNDERTFQISGSIGVQHSTGNVFIPGTGLAHYPPPIY